VGNPNVILHSRRTLNGCVALAVALKPDGITLVKKNVIQLLGRPLSSAGLLDLHDKFVPFPGSGQRIRFREQFTAAYSKLPASRAL